MLPEILRDRNPVVVLAHSLPANDSEWNCPLIPIWQGPNNRARRGSFLMAVNGKKAKDDLQTFCADGETLNVVIETPRGSRNKFSFDPERGAFRLKSVLPAGAAFPYDFGF